VHTGCGAPVRLVSVCTAGHRLGRGDDVHLEPGPGAPVPEQEPR
jgi:hypothetical protein